MSDLWPGGGAANPGGTAAHGPGGFAGTEFDASDFGASGVWPRKPEAGGARAGVYEPGGYAAADSPSWPAPQSRHGRQAANGHNRLANSDVPGGHRAADDYQDAGWGPLDDEFGRGRSGSGLADAGGYGQVGPDGESAGGWGERPEYGDDGGEADSWHDEPAEARLMHRFGRRGGGRRSGRWRHRWLVVGIWVIALMIIALLLGIGANIVSHWVANKYGDWQGIGYGTVKVQVQPGDSATSLAPKLVQLGVIESVGPFDSAANASPSQTALQPGIYKLRHHMNAAKAWALLLNPTARISTGVTLPEGLRASDIIAVLSDHTKVPVSTFRQALANAAALGLPPFANGRPEGYLFPSTYQFAPHESATAILQQMVTEFKNQAVGLRLPEAAAGVHLSESQVIIMASLVQAEAGRQSDFGPIARVIFNRLGRNMPLQLDSTIFYALHKYGSQATNAQLNVNSPYNTYRHRGLPPGPIDNPGAAAIKAVLSPPHGNWLYFITVNRATKVTKFTNSYQQFLRWKQQAASGGG